MSRSPACSLLPGWDRNSFRQKPRVTPYVMEMAVPSEALSDFSLLSLLSVLLTTGTKVPNHRNLDNGWPRGFTGSLLAEIIVRAQMSCFCCLKISPLIQSNFWVYRRMEMLLRGFQYEANVTERPFSHYVHRAPYYIRLTSPRLPPQAYITISESSPDSTRGIGSPRDSGRPLVPDSALLRLLPGTFPQKGWVTPSAVHEALSLISETPTFSPPTIYHTPFPPTMQHGHLWAVPFH